jgi:hypothetical protein
VPTIEVGHASGYDELFSGLGRVKNFTYNIDANEEYAYKKFFSIL